eukprot:TRINITY_DN102434_c0_g1_i1.p1 TRINITY_DN102434_c0_g1~~TRINITY_DN102434_c0_g1_i1.p1  ORF type:complete len:408 (-),score=25.77 TRINITY_DN102434_c0_g1_i1:15-1175(-)
MALFSRWAAAGRRLLLRQFSSAEPPGRHVTQACGATFTTAVFAASCLLGNAQNWKPNCEGPGPEDEQEGPDLEWQWASDTCGLWRRKWHPDWDGRAPPTGEKDIKIKPHGRIRHLIFVRHGQYDLEDASHGLTEKGREQSRLLGERLAKMHEEVQKDRNGEIHVRFEGIWQSDVLRAKQTAQILSDYLPGVKLHPPDPVLAEGQPCVPHPHKKPGDVNSASLWEDSTRIESAFRKYVHREVDHKRLAKKDAKRRLDESKANKDPAPQTIAADFHPGASQSDTKASVVSQATDAKMTASGQAPRKPGTSEKTSKAGAPEHTYEIIVCHCNVIRYIVMRALQLPPEAWLRLGGYNTSITEIVVRPTGSCSLVRFGDTGHLPLNMVTFH